MTKILLVEDELLIANYIKEILEAENYEVVGIARDSEKALELFNKHTPNLVCMDINLKGKETGIDTARKMRNINSFGLVYLTAYGMKDLVIEAQETKPLGFLVKPVTDQTILATVSTALSISENSEFPVKNKCQKFKITFKDSSEMTVDISKGTAIHNDQIFHLTSTECRLIHHLLENNRVVTPFEHLRELVWNDCTVSDASLKTVVWRIRHKFKQLELITTVAGFGYIIDEDVEKLDS